jgi:hypothetical protein
VKIERESLADALENDRCGICGSVDHFREDCTLVHAWPGGGHPKTGPVPGRPGVDYANDRLYQHTCGHVESWSTAVGPIDDEGCDACEGASWPGSWQPLYRKADSYEVRR